MTAATTMIQPTASQLASAEMHLSRRAQWIYYWVKGVRYVSLPSSDMQRVYAVRADAKGCSCDAYQRWGYSACAHMIAVANAASIDALSEYLADAADALLDEYDIEHRFASCLLCGANRTLDAVMTGTPCPCRALVAA